MGNIEDNNKKNDYLLEVNQGLMDDIQKEINIKKRRKIEKRFKKMVHKKLKGKIKKTNLYEKFNKNEKGIKNTSNLLNLIYDENINKNYNRGIGHTFYEGVFGIKNIPEKQIEDNNEPLDNNIENMDVVKNESKLTNVHNSFNNNDNLEINNNSFNEFNEGQNPYLENENNIQDNCNNIKDYNIVKTQNNSLYNTEFNNEG